MGSKRQKRENLPFGSVYLFVSNSTNNFYMFNDLVSQSEGQLYGLFNNELIPIDAYAYSKDFYSDKVLRCLGEGEFVGIEFNDGSFSVGLKSFIEKPENKNICQDFSPKKKVKNNP